MTMMLNVAITAPVTLARGPLLQLRDGPCESLSLQAAFLYVSGGATASFWAQTSFDDGLTWCDVANFSFTTGTNRLTANCSSLTSLGPVAPTNGALAGNTSNNGVFGSLWSILYTTTGTYAGTIIRIDGAPSRGRFTSR